MIQREDKKKEKNLAPHHKTLSPHDVQSINLIDCANNHQSLFFTMLFPFSISDVIAPAELVAPVIVIAPKNTSVVAGASEATLECIANARWVALRQWLLISQMFFIITLFLLSITLMSFSVSPLNCVISHFLL